MDEHIAVTLTANAGVLMRFPCGAGCAVDALHDEKQRGWSTVTPEMLPRIWSAFGPEGPGLVMATHSHPDHFSPRLWAEARKMWPGAVLVSPEGEEGALRPQGELFSFEAGGFSVEARRLPHEGREYAGVPHYGYLISREGFTVLCAGDCAVCAPALAEWLGGRRPDLAILDFPWLTLTRGRRYTEDIIRPRRLFLCHLPFEGDDLGGYLPAALAAAGKETEIGDVRCLTRPFETLRA